jgi:hypothetical protein
LEKDEVKDKKLNLHSKEFEDSYYTPAPWRRMR